MEHQLHRRDPIPTRGWVKGLGNLLSSKALVFFPVKISTEKKKREIKEKKNKEKHPTYQDKAIMLMNSGLNWY